MVGGHPNEHLRCVRVCAQWNEVQRARASPTQHPSTPSSTEIQIFYNDRAYIVESCTNGGTFSGEMFAAKRFPLLGTVLNVTVDLSSAGCGCNVSTPAANALIERLLLRRTLTIRRSRLHAPAPRPGR